MLNKVLVEKGEFELKYTFLNLLSPYLEGWLSLNCLRDKRYPESRVQSIYFESSQLDSYMEKVNSDFFKSKFRVRWYESERNGATNTSDDIPIYLENKMKIGTKRLKERWEETADFNKMKNKSLSSTYHTSWYNIFVDKLQKPLPYLQPFIQISYIRKRFIEKTSGCRLNLDYNIRIEKTNPLFLPPSLGLMLGNGVFEIKSSSSSPPSALSYLTQNVVKTARFSKYEQCVSAINL